MAERKTKACEIIIIGAGPAGMTAAIYAGRAGKSVIIVDKDGYGGQIAKSPTVENIPGFTSISGSDFATNMYEQMTAQENVEHIIGEAILIKYYHGLFVVSLDDKSVIQGKSLIFATGTQPRKLNIDTPNLYTCVLCDGPFFKKKSVLVLGSGNTGATYALSLAAYCKHVYLCDITMNMLCEPILANRIKKTENITFLPNCTVKSVKNKDNKLETVTLTTYDTIKVNAIFNATGMIPQTTLAKQYMVLDNKGYLTESLVPGAFAAGDCSQTKIKQVTTACASGAVAAVDAITYLNTLEK